MRRRKLFPPAFLLLLLLSFLREGTSQSTIPETEVVTEVYTYIITEDPGTTTEGSITEEYSTEITETITITEAPETTTEGYITEEYSTEITETITTTEAPGTTTEGYITEEYSTEITETTTITEAPETTVRPSRILEPWAIILISLAAAAVLTGLCVGFGFLLKKMLHLRSPFSAATYHPHDSNIGLNHGLSGLHHRWGWKKATPSTTTMEMGGGHNMPSTC